MPLTPVGSNAMNVNLRYATINMDICQFRICWNLPIYARLYKDMPYKDMPYTPNATLGDELCQAVLQRPTVQCNIVLRNSSV